MRETNFVIESKQDQHQIYVCEWLPDVNTPLRGIVQLIHGSCEHVGRYKNFAQFLTSRGYGVYAHDHRGHGHSVKTTEELGYFGEKQGWQKLVTDCYDVNEMIRMKYTDKKIVVLGHSMGSFIARHYAILYDETIDGLILTGTAHQPKGLLGLGIGLANRAIAKGDGKKVHHLLDRMSYGSFPLKFYKEKDSSAWLTTDLKIREAFKEDDLCGFKFTAAAFRDMFEGLQVITDVENMKKMRNTLPIALFSGEDDPVGGFGKMVIKTESLMKSAGMKNITLKLYPGMRHEILNETRRSEVYQDVLGWIQKIM